MTMKKSGVLITVFVLASFLLSLVAVAAQQYFTDGGKEFYKDASGKVFEVQADGTEVPVVAGSSAAATSSGTGNFWQERYDLWLHGYSSTNFNLAGETLKWLVLLLIIALVYSALAQAQFPDNMIARLVVALVIGILATFLLTSEDLLTAMQSYSALGMTLLLFFPFLILGFFTIVTASAANPFGIFIQKILWVIYSIYLILNSLIILVLMNTKTGGNAFWSFFKDYLVTPLLGGQASPALNQAVANANGVALVVMIIAAIVALTITRGDNFLIAWLASQKAEADILKEKMKVKRSSGYDKIRSDEVEGKE